ncbi:MAG: metallophosphoesterase [Clostridia bacterium]|nr:metallophosphoesterase [Clostridia bacterium]
MIYVIGDIHGNKEKYDEMLTKLSPKDTDAVFVLGDVIDVGEDSVEILKDMMYRTNIYPVLGEHEYMAKKILPLIINAKNLDEAKAMLEGEDKENLDKWLSMKSEKTISDFLSLNEEDKESIIDYLSEFQPFEEVEANGKTFVLAHAGIDNFEDGKNLEEYAEEDFVFAKTDYSKVYFKNKYLITGHTPTVAINQKFMGKVYSKNGHIALDCGAAYGGKLAAICLDALKLTYC